MTERTELINDIEKLKAERNRLLRQVEEAEQWEGVAWDSFNSLTDHIRATEKKQVIAQNYDTINSTRPVGTVTLMLFQSLDK